MIAADKCRNSDSNIAIIFLRLLIFSVKSKFMTKNLWIYIGNSGPWLSLQINLKWLKFTWHSGIPFQTDENFGSGRQEGKKGKKEREIES